MADTIRRVSYYYTTIPDKPGEGTRLLDALRRAGVNLLALHAFPSARKAQVDFVPSDAAVFEAAAKGAKIKLSKPKTAFLVDGDDRVGALAGVLGRLAWRVMKSASRSFTVTVRAARPPSRRSALARSARASSLAASAWSSSRSVGNVSSRLTDLASRSGSTGAASLPRTRPYSHVPARSPSQRTRVSRSCPPTSRTVRRPKPARRSWNLGPMAGRSARANRRMNSGSAPGA